MRYLIDTCALIWFFKDDQKQMSSSLMEKVEDPANDVFVSVASIWEMAIKSSLGKLELLNAITQSDLIEKGLLKKNDSGGRSTSYLLNSDSI